ncbi:hypothetical protein NLI96_g12205 [Meripilus lineatus]|uniref:Uncharacterized protein n=1 Tax=Meripilus lineatus TaxID=2056292 RepID=A0AAD5UQB5_9APHY|nr:hypothetical protein NLI96_g12205 [Physisporinus lineatus]
MDDLARNENTLAPLGAMASAVDGFLATIVFARDVNHQDMPEIRYEAMECIGMADDWPGISYADAKERETNNYLPSVHNIQLLKPIHDLAHSISTPIAALITDSSERTTGARLYP